MSNQTIMQLCNAVVSLFAPLAEVVIHDIPSDTIDYINGNMSKRKVGDPSLLDNSIKQSHNWAEQSYSKFNYDGRVIKSISIPYRTDKLICLNCDISVFQKMNMLASAFINDANTSQNPKALFKNDWQEQVHIAIHDFIEENKWHFDQLSNAQKKTIITPFVYSKLFRTKKCFRIIYQKQLQ